MKIYTDVVHCSVKRFIGDTKISSRSNFVVMHVVIEDAKLKNTEFEIERKGLCTLDWLVLPSCY